MNEQLLEDTYGAHNYAPLPVTLVSASGIYCKDINGKQYIDMLGAYSAVSHGHCHPVIVEALCKQAHKLAVTSRAFYTDNLGIFLEKACQLTGMDKALPMNSGAEAVETAIKCARKWAYQVKKIPENQAEIIVCNHNFHGRTTTIISMSTEPQYKDGFGPLTPGFKAIPYDDIDALSHAINANTAAFLVEPIQGEAGIIVPSKGYLKACAELCKAHNVLLLVDEIQTGLGRTGRLLACDHEQVKPDGLMLGKALGGGLLPVSLFLARADMMEVFTPGDHGSTFGGNPLAAKVGLTALQLLIAEKLIENAAKMGDYFMQCLREMHSPFIKEIRGKGLLIGVEVHAGTLSAKALCKRLLEVGILTKETHKTAIRFAPPLIITQSQIDEAMEKIRHVFGENQG